MTVYGLLFELQSMEPQTAPPRLRNLESAKIIDVKEDNYREGLEHVLTQSRPNINPARRCTELCLLNCIPNILQSHGF